jgi:activator of HSP90 ATPase
MPIHQEVSIEATPERVYQLLTDSAEFAAATERPAEIEATKGGAFSVFGGNIQGRMIELVPEKRIVQSWRGIDWAPGQHSLARFYGQQ